MCAAPDPTSASAPSCARRSTPCASTTSGARSPDEAPPAADHRLRTLRGEPGSRLRRPFLGGPLPAPRTDRRRQDLRPRRRLLRPVRLGPRRPAGQRPGHVPAQRPRSARHPHRGHPRPHRRGTPPGADPAAPVGTPQEAWHGHHHGQGPELAARVRRHGGHLEGPQPLPPGDRRGDQPAPRDEQGAVLPGRPAAPGGLRTVPAGRRRGPRQAPRPASSTHAASPRPSRDSPSSAAPPRAKCARRTPSCSPTRTACSRRRGASSNCPPPTRRPATPGSPTPSSRGPPSPAPPPASGSPSRTSR